MRVQVWIWRITLRQLASTAGHRGWRGVLTGLSVLGASALAAVLARATLAGGTLPVGVVLTASTVATELVCCAATVAALCSMTDDYPIRTALAAIPITDGTILLGVVTPVMTTLLLGGWLLVPTIAVSIAALTGAGVVWQPAVSAVLLGVAAGLLLSAATRALVRRLGGSRGSVYPAGIVGLVGLATARIAAVRSHRLELLVPPSPFGLALAGVALAGALVTYCYLVPDDLGRPGESRPLVRWSPTWPCAPFLLELVRLGRQPRLVGSAFAVLAVCAGGLLWLRGAGTTRDDVLGAVLTVSAVSLVHPFLLLRGYSPVPYVPQVLLGQSPAGWLLRVGAVGAVLAGGPVLTLLVTVAGPAGYAVFYVGLSALAAGLGLALGVLRPLRAGALAAETAWLLAAGSGLYAALIVLGHQFRTPASLGAACLLAGVLALTVAVQSERRRAKG